MHRAIGLLAAALVLGGCGGNRMAQPVAMVQPTDTQLTCDSVQMEMMTNQTKVQALYSEIDRAQDDRTRNMFFGGLIGYATSEDGSAARAEIGALQSRNTHLMLMMQRGGCWSGAGRPAAAPMPAGPMAAPMVAPATAMPATDADAVVVCRLSGGVVQQLSRAYCVTMGGQPVG